MPLVSRTFDQLIDFTRTSSATFVGSNGLIQSTPASRNLLTFTQEFDNAAWSKLNATATANSTAAPDGTSTADTFQATATTGAHNLQQSGGGSGAPLTLSVYAKAGTHSFLQLSQGSAVGIFANFNLSTGALGTVGASAAASITSVGSGWYRCSMTFTPASAANMRIGMVTSGTAVYTESWTAAGTETIFLWGAQLELGSAASDYTRNFGGLFPPRFDYDPVTLAPRGLLIEEQRTNFEWSQDLDNAFWTKSGASVTANTTTAPDGTTTADKLVENTATSTHFAARFPTIAAATSYSFSVYIKAAGRTFARVLVGDTAGANGVYVDANLATGATATGTNGTGWTLISASATAAGDGWFRVVISGTNATATTNGIVLIYPSSASGVISYAGDGASGLFVWGAQFETGAFATSYIPTAASQVTRTADIATINAPNFAPWYRADEGTFVADFDALVSANVSNANVLSAYASGTNLNRIWMWSGAPGVVRNSVVSGGSGVAELTGATLAANIPLKAGATYKVNDFAFTTNGGALATDTSGALPTGINLLGLGQLGNSSEFLNGHIRSIRYYPVRLSNAQLQALTA